MSLNLPVVVAVAHQLLRAVVMLQALQEQTDLSWFMNIRGHNESINIK
jgi:hypothetical protein